MKATFRGRAVQVEKHRKEDVLVGDRVVSRMIYKDGDGNKFIKRKDGGLSKVRLYRHYSAYHVHIFYEIVEGE